VKSSQAEKKMHFRGRAMSNEKYHAVTICVHSGKTYWNKSQDSLDGIYDHLKRYCNRDCHVAIYKQKAERKPLEFIKHISNWGAI